MSVEEFESFVDGKRVNAAGADTADLLDPCTEEVYGRLPLSRGPEVEQAMAAAQTGFQQWRSTTPAERQRSLLAIADALESRIPDFQEAEVRDTGSAAAGREVPLMVDQLRFFAGSARTLDGISAGEYVADHTSYVRREPLGVCAQLAPWNFPLLMAVLKSAPAIAAGNSVVLKPAPTTPSTALMLADLTADILPPGVLNVLCGDGETGRLMVDHRAPAMVSLTGSVATGMAVARAAAADLKRLHLELGGKSPVLVFSDCDLSDAVDGILLGAFTNAGQDCTAASRVLVDATIHDELLERLVDGARRCLTGPPSDANAAFGPLNNAGQLKRVAGFIERLPDHATIHCGGSRQGTQGYFFEPTVISGVHAEDEICRREVFGPVITVEKFDSEQQAVALANGVEQGLASAVWTTDHARAMRMSTLIDAGCVWVNTHLGFPTEMPHGGFKHSGYGKDMSVYSMHEYTRVKHVMHRM